MAKNPKLRGGAPPKEYQFKPGQSGNPGGRPKGRRTMRAAIDEALDRMVPVNTQAGRCHMPLRDALANSIVSQVGSDPELFIKLMRWLEGERAPAMSAAPVASDAHGDVEDETIFRSAMDREMRRRLQGEDEDV